MEQNRKKEAVIGTKFDFQEKKFFSQQFLKMCLNDPKKDDFPTFSKDVSEHLGTAPTSRG